MKEKTEDFSDVHVRQAPEIEYSMGDGMNFFVDDDSGEEDDYASSPSFMLTWCSDPAEMAREMRKCADWLDAHIGLPLVCDID